MTYDLHRFEFEGIQGWEQLPDGWSFVEVAGVAVDSHDRVYVFNRGEHPVIVFDKDGQFLTAWGRMCCPPPCCVLCCPDGAPRRYAQ